MLICKKISLGMWFADQASNKVLTALKYKYYLRSI